MATEVHHVKPVDTYPELALDINNLEPLCRDCHDATRRRRDEAGIPARVIRITDGGEG